MFFSNFHVGEQFANFQTPKTAISHCFHLPTSVIYTRLQVLSLMGNDYGFNVAYSKHHVLHRLVDLQTCQR